MPSELTHLVSSAEPVLEKYGYLGLFLCNFAEGVGIPLPGQMLLVGAAFLATRDQFEISAVWLCSLTATILGNCLGYWIGYYGGRALMLRLRVSPKRLARVEAFCDRRGMIVIFVARFVDGLRQTVPLVAGSMHMSWWSFLWATTLGSVAWVSVWGIGAYYLGSNYHRVLAEVHWIVAHGWWLAALILIFLFAWLKRSGQGDQ